MCSDTVSEMTHHCLLEPDQATKYYKGSTKDGAKNSQLVCLLNMAIIIILSDVARVVCLHFRSKNELL